MTDVHSNIQNGKYNIKAPYLGDRNTYNAEVRRISDEFYQDCCDELGLDPRAASSEKLFQKAYEDGHGFGHGNIYTHLVDLYEFIQVYNGLKRGED